MPSPKELTAYLKKHDRIKSPWKKFKPSVYYSKDTQIWYVYFEDEPSYTEPNSTIKANLYRSTKDDHITGLDIYKENLDG